MPRRWPPRLGLLFYNLWHLFLCLLQPDRQVESAGGRRWFLLIAARLVQSGRQKTLQIRNRLQRHYPGGNLLSRKLDRHYHRQGGV